MSSNTAGIKVITRYLSLCLVGVSKLTVETGLTQQKTLTRSLGWLERQVQSPHSLLHRCHTASPAPIHCPPLTLQLPAAHRRFLLLLLSSCCLNRLSSPQLVSEAKKAQMLMEIAARNRPKLCGNECGVLMNPNQVARPNSGFRTRAKLNVHCQFISKPATDATSFVSVTRCSRDRPNASP